MKSTLILALLLASTSVLAFPGTYGKSYRLKTHHGNYVTQNGNALELGDGSGAQSFFRFERRGTSYILRASDGRYISALERTQNDQDSLGAVSFQVQPKGFETFALEKRSGVRGEKYSIKSTHWNTYLRATGANVVDQTLVNSDWEQFTFVEVPSFDLAPPVPTTNAAHINSSVGLLQTMVRQAYELVADGEYIYLNTYEVDNLLEKVRHYEELTESEQFKLTNDLLNFNMDFIKTLTDALVRQRS